MATTPPVVSRFGPPSFAFFTEILPVRTEIEWLGGLQGFDYSSNPHASGGAYAQASYDVSSAGGVFEGRAGLYDLTLGYMDETDGVSYMEVLVNGRVITAFDWDKPEGTAVVTAATRAEHLVAGMALAPGDVIEVRGAQDSGEPLRTDYLDIAASASPALGSLLVQVP